MMKKVKKIAIIIIAMSIMISAFTITVNAGTVQTTEFGTFQYDLSIYQPSPRDYPTANAATSISSPGPGKTVITTMEVQYNATGQHITTLADSKPGGSSASVSYTNTNRETLAAFSCHEARGNSSIVRYMSSTF